MRRLRPAAEPLPDIEAELRQPHPERYQSGLARMLAQWAASDPFPESARRRLELAHKYEEGARR